MSFGAMAAWQAWALLAAAAGLAAWVFLLKLRPPRVFVPSLLLWRRVLDEQRQLTLWERIRRAVSLAATVLIAVALALAIVRPSRQGGAAAASGGRLLLVIDSSWSMLTRTSHGESRWDRAIAQARRLAAAAAGDEIALATTADGLVEGPTRDLTLIDAGLDRIAPAGGEASAWPRMANTRVVHFLTDGAVPRQLEPDVVVDSVFEAAPNVAITAFDVRPAVADSAGTAGDAYLEIANFGSSAQVVALTVLRGNAVVLERQLDVGAGEAVRQVLPLPRGGEALLRARVDAAENALAIDDEATAWIDEAQPLEVAVVGQQTDWIAPLLSQDAGVHATFVLPAAYRAGEEDVVIFDRWAPVEHPARPALCFEPPPDTPWLTGGGRPAADEGHPLWRHEGDHPVLRGVDPSTFSIERTRAYGSPALEAIATSERGTGLVSIEQSADRRAVVVGFGPADSNLTGAPGFPVLVGNALEWLARPRAGRSQRPGEIAFDAAVTKVTGPDGHGVALERVDDAVVGVLRAPGIYVAEGGGAAARIAVNVGDPQVSNVQRTSLTGSAERRVSAGASDRPWWAYCAVAAFALVLLEWWTWQRRITV